MPYICPDSPLNVHFSFRLRAMTDKELDPKLEQRGIRRLSLHSYLPDGVTFLEGSARVPQCLLWY